MEYTVTRTDGNKPRQRQNQTQTDRQAHTLNLPPPTHTHTYRSLVGHFKEQSQRRVKPHPPLSSGESCTDRCFLLCSCFLQRVRSKCTTISDLRQNNVSKLTLPTATTATFPAQHSQTSLKTCTSQINILQFFAIPC